MSERGSGFGSFLLGLGIGAALGLLFAPEPGGTMRTKVTRKLRGLGELAAEKAGELGQVLEAADDDPGDEPPARVALERRLTEAKGRRRARRGGGPALPRPLEGASEEEDEPLA